MKSFKVWFWSVTVMLIASASNAQTVTHTSLTVTQIVSGLSLPTAIAFIGSNDFLVLEKNTGQVRRVIDGALQTSPVLDVAVDNTGERGLLGIALHPGFATNNFVYLCYTESSTGNDSTSVDPLGIRVYRYEWTGSVLTNGTLIFEFPVEPGVANHNGGAIAFGPDGKLYAVTGDHERFGQLQNQPAGPAPDDTGVIVRLNDDGSAPSDNPFFAQGGNLAKYYAYGVRNSFGLTFDPVSGKLWDTENGPDHYDEVNLVEPGFNSGWREIMGPASRSSGSTNDLFVAPGSQYADPQFSWLTTVAPTGLTFLNSTALGAQYENDLFVGDFNLGNLYHFTVNQLARRVGAVGRAGRQSSGQQQRVGRCRFRQRFRWRHFGPESRARRPAVRRRPRCGQSVGDFCVALSRSGRRRAQSAEEDYPEHDLHQPNRETHRLDPESQFAQRDDCRRDDTE